MLEHLAEVWDQPDHGIWERRGDGKHYVFSKVMTWVAFDRAIKSAEKFGFKAPLEQWRALRDTIHRDVCDKGFDREQNSFRRILRLEIARCQHPAAAVGGLPAAGRSAGARHDRGDRETHDARRLRAAARSARGVRRRSSRSRARSSPARLWLADAYVLAGEIDKAQALFDRVVAVANDLGLLAEEYDTGAGRQTGNFPQALTHIALINTAQNLSHAKKPTEKPAMQRSK